VPTGKIH